MNNSNNIGNENNNKGLLQIINELNNKDFYGDVEKYHIATKKTDTNGYVKFVEKDENKKNIFAKKYSISYGEKDIDYYIVNPILEKGEIKANSIYRLLKTNGNIKVKKLMTDVEKKYVLDKVLNIELGKYIIKNPKE